jgi:tetratricopeptide (TPR) repeat protein
MSVDTIERKGRASIKKAVLLGLLSILPFFDSEIYSKGFARQPINLEAISTCDDAADKAMMGHDYETGIVLHERFLKKNSRNGRAWYHLGYAYGQVGDHEKEVHFYEKAIALGFKDDYILFNLGMAYGEMGQIVKSVATFQKALSKNPKDPDSYYGLGFGYYLCGEKELARDALRRAIEIAPDHVDARTLLGVIGENPLIKRWN